MRDEMVRSGLARTTVNARVNRVRRVFSWAASMELVPGTHIDALGKVKRLREGRTAAPEPAGVRPVAPEHVEAVLPLLPAPVAAMVRLQIRTGCRSGEAMRMSDRDLTCGETNWEYRPVRHKNTWRGQDRVIVLGSRAQEVIRPFLNTDPDEFLFSPRDAVASLHARRRTGRDTKPTPSELRRRRGAPGRKHGARYSRRSDRQAIVRACRKAGVPPWTPLQLRHTAATAIRAKFGLEAAQSVLGHRKPDTTTLYAERDLARAHAVMSEIG